MKLGFIGTGEITKSIVLGISKSKIKYKSILISKRNNKISSYLKKINKKVKITSNNQFIIDNSDWIFLAITPNVGKKILKKLKFKKNKIIISLISTIKLKELKILTNKKAKIVRAIPLPPISIMKGPIPLFPKNTKVAEFFNNIGDSIEINNETSSLNFWATSSLMAPYYELLNEVSKWLQKKGLKKQHAQKYVASLFSALSDAAVMRSNKDLKLLVRTSQTPKGLNEQTLKFLKKKGFYKQLKFSLEKILKRLK
ncbi:pyrroline-5-carboxylate reductase [Candidatus Pelagibacter sp.]|nr:pyrroline-5-carboxylate reductase [Candidatus Pelagibacter sp.]MDA9709215.1 pyrroline-5-carboxylate reductase [Candidatus Pelagibacter sp.]